MRYERQHPGELLHLDIKKLGGIVQPGHRLTGDRRIRARGRAGWEYVFVAIDDHSRLAHAAIHPNEQAASAVAFLREAVAHYERFGIKLQRVMTDMAPASTPALLAAPVASSGSGTFAPGPYTPRTNGKAERFIQSSLREWAYGSLFTSSAHRAEGLPHWIHRYNWHRPHSALHRQPPVSRLRLPENNLLTLHS